MDYARILNQYRSLTVGFQQNITGSNRYPKIFVTAPSLRPVLSIASICELESMDNNHCAIYFGIAKLKLTTDREIEIIYNVKSAVRITDVLLELQWEWGCSKKYPGLVHC